MMPVDAPKVPVPPPVAISTPATVIPLTQLEPGSTAVLKEVCDSRSCAVLRSLGLMGGATFRLCRVGDPCIIQVRSTRIGISKAVADSVTVTSTEAVVVSDGAAV